MPDDQRFGAYLPLEALKKAREVLPADHAADKKLVAGLLQISVRIVEKIWKQARDQIQRGEQVDVSNKKKGRSGRKRKDHGLERIPTIPYNKRSTMRALALALKVPYTSLQRRLKWGQIRKHTSTIKPYLKLANQIHRLKFSVSMVDQTTVSDAMPKFIDMRKIVHTDEKWFELTKKKRTYYLTPEEAKPERSIQSKSRIGKVMFLCAVARPRRDANGVTFDGKIGIWPFIKLTPARKKSKNRAKGTMEVKTVTVTRDVHRDYLCNKVLPAIEALWPDDDEGTIYIQQDNTRTHVLPSDPAFLSAVRKTGMDIQLMQQPANSPDMNVLDLAYFRSIQSLTLETAPKNLGDLIESVEDAFHIYPVDNLDKVFITLQSVLLEVMNARGGNKYEIPHMNKDKMLREGTLPMALRIDGELYRKTLEIIAAYEAEALSLSNRETTSKKRKRKGVQEGVV